MKILLLILSAFPSVLLLQAQTIFQYDADGNIVSINYTGNKPCNTVPGICSGSTASYYSGVANAAAYQWQVDTGAGFINIGNNAVYSGVNTSLLVVQNAPTSWYGYKYRCMITTNGTTTYTNPETLKFIAVWLGTVSQAWEDPLNWECNKLPDANTDVVVKGGSSFMPLVSSTAFGRSVRLEGNATCRVLTGSLKITGHESNR